MSEAAGTDNTTVDVTGARAFTEAAAPPVAGGTWYLRSDGTVVYEWPSGERAHPAVITAGTLQNRADLFTEQHATPPPTFPGTTGPCPPGG